MLRNRILLAVAAALMVLPAVSSASELTRRLTIRYPGQDGRKCRDRHEEERRRDERRDDRRDRDRRDDRGGWDGRRDR